MTEKEIKKSYSARKLNEIARGLPKEKACEMFSAIEIILLEVYGRASSCMVHGMDPPPHEVFSKKHLQKIKEWQDYMVKQKEKYTA